MIDNLGPFVENPEDFLDSEAMKKHQEKLAYYFWDKAGKPEGKSEHFWKRAGWDLEQQKKLVVGDS